MAGVNKVFFIGRIRDLGGRELSDTPGKVSVRFNLEVPGWYFNSTSGKGSTITEVIPVVYYARSPKILDYLADGRSVFIEGALHANRGDEGRNNILGITVYASNLQLIGTRGDDYKPRGREIATLDEDDLPY